MKTETETPGTTTQSTTYSTTTRKTPGGKGVLITGGSRSTSAEIFLPNSPNKRCILPDLPRPFYWHTQEGGMICGGQSRNGTMNNCHQWIPEEGKFTTKPVHEFNPPRDALVSWTPVSQRETFLIGGSGSPDGASQKTSSIVKSGVFDGSKGFDLKYKLYGSCAVPDPETDTVVIIGGNHEGNPGNKITSLYNEDGWVEDFGNLHHQRWWHGCTSYVADNKRVGNKLLFF